MNGNQAMPYSVLIADDEELIRKGLIARLEHLGYRPARVYEAANGVQALELLGRATPDIVITDIRMPQMEGLEFIQKARELAPEAEFVILSGYAQFAYARKAIKLGVRAYLIKPLSNDELAGAMRELTERLQEREKLHLALEQAQTRDGLARKWELEAQVAALLTGGGKGGLSQPLAGFLAPPGWYVVALLHAGAETGSETPEAARERLYRLFWEKHAGSRELLAKNPADGGQCYLLARGDAPEGARQYTVTLIQRMQQELRPWNVVLTAGVGEPGQALAPVHARQAREALYRRITQGSGRVFCYGGPPPAPGESLPAKALERLRRQMEQRDFEGIEATLGQMLRQAGEQSLHAATLRLLWMRVLDLLADASGGGGALPWDRFVLDNEDMRRFSAIEEMQSELFGLIRGALERQPESGDGSDRTRKAAEYIRANYSQELAVNDLAERFSFSPNYFSTMFRREMGVTVSAYIKRVRLERACELLRATGESVVDIARRVGYSDSQYFFRVFKKEVGLSPLQYRRGGGKSS